MAKKRVSRSDRFLKALADCSRIAVVTHNNPDPDGISSGWALAVLVESKLHKPVDLVAGGAIMRAENRRMIELCGPPLKLLDTFDIPDTGGAVVVDCQPNAVGHVVSGTISVAVAVIDHHEVTGRPFRVKHRDIRPRVAATASIAAEYLIEQGVDATPELATALLYGIRTDTSGWDAVFSRTDRRAVSWLTGRADHSALADIEHAPLPRAHYADLLLALENTFVYDDAALCFLPRASGAETIAEVADLLSRCEAIRRVLCGAIVDGDLLVSVRTARDGGDATALLARTLRGRGHFGGHSHRAGGKIQLVGERPAAIDDLHGELRGRWLAACETEQHRGTRLVARKEIIASL